MIGFDLGGVAWLGNFEIIGLSLARWAAAAARAGSFAQQGIAGRGRVKYMGFGIIRAPAAGRKMGRAVVCGFCRSKNSHSVSAQVNGHLHGSTFGLILAEAIRAIVVARFDRLIFSIEEYAVVRSDLVDPAVLLGVLQVVHLAAV